MFEPPPLLLPRFRPRVRAEARHPTEPVHWFQQEVLYIARRNHLRRVLDPLPTRGLGLRLPLCDKRTRRPLEAFEGRPLKPYAIVKYFETYNDGKYIYLVMEYVQGK